MREMEIKRYSELKNIETFNGRFEYLKLGGVVGMETFGFDRYLNQALYKSKEWKRVREQIILRDNGCDLGIEGHDIIGRMLIIHHMNPITERQILDRDPIIFDPEFLILVSHKTHNAIHYGTEIDQMLPMERTKNDTCPWRK